MCKSFSASISVHCLLPCPIPKLDPRATFKFSRSSGGWHFYNTENTCTCWLSKLKKKQKDSFLSCIFYQSIVASECEGERRKMATSYFYSREISDPMPVSGRTEDNAHASRQTSLGAIVRNDLNKPQLQLTKLFTWVYSLYSIGMYLKPV